LTWNRAALRAARPVLAAAMGGVLVLGAWRSVDRAAAWHDNEALLRDVDTVAADNYRAHRTRALYLDRGAHLDDAAREYRKSIALWGQDPKVYENLAILLQRQGHVDEAMAVLADGLRVDPAAPAMRSKLFYLHLTRGELPAARETAAAGVAMGDTIFAALVRRADSARDASATSPSTTRQ
jgi:Tfp pilus assembly protein PilF